FSFCLSLFTPTSTTVLSTLSLHDALPIFLFVAAVGVHRAVVREQGVVERMVGGLIALHGRGEGEPLLRHVIDQLGHGPRLARILDRKSTRLNSSHQIISYAVFCLKKKKKK